MKPFARAASFAALLMLTTAAGGLAPAFAETPDDQLVVGFSMSNILTLDPAAITGRETVQVLANIYEGFVSLDAVNRSTGQSSTCRKLDNQRGQDENNRSKCAPARPSPRAIL